VGRRRGGAGATGNSISPAGAERLLDVRWRRLRLLHLAYQQNADLEADAHGFRDRHPEEFRAVKARLEARHLGLVVWL
jgi:hypothetical protein